MGADPGLGPDQRAAILNESYGVGMLPGGLPDARPRHAPVMLFGLAEPAGSEYVAKRMTYRGDDEWMLFDVGPLEHLAPHVATLGTDAFFDPY